MGNSMVFVDWRVADIDLLLAGIPSSIEVAILDGSSDGLEQIAEHLQGRTGINAIHIISHGSSGSLSLGNGVIDAAALVTRASLLGAIGNSLTANGDILLYGCNIATGDAGVQFIGSLAQATAADIAASVNPSGPASLSGDWLLEAACGSIETQPLSSTIYPRLLGVNTAPTFVLGDGALMTGFGTKNDVGYSVALLADGKIAVTGYTIADGITNFAVVRYNADGSLDSSFDGDGKLVTAIGDSHNYGYSVVIQPDGKMLVAGQVASSIFSDFVLLRFNNDGSFDSSFDSDGKVTTDLGQPWESGQVVALQSDDKILVAGTSSGFGLVRYNSDGSLDGGFDGDGKVVASLGGYGEAFSMAIQADGRIVVGGYSATGANDDFTLVRFNADGTLDTNFDGDGKVTTDFGTVVVQAYGAGNDQVRAMAVDAAGNILAAGSNLNGTTGNYDFAIARYRPDGSLDTSFSLDGMLTTDFGPGSNDVATGIAIQPDGKILVAGYCGNIYAPDFAVARYNADGSLDSGFGANGRVITSLSANGDFARSLALQSDGKIVVAGSAYNGSNSDFALVRYNPDGSLDVTFDSARNDALNNSPVFTLRGTAVVLDSSVRIYDAELFAGGNYAGASVTLHRHGGANADDVFSATDNLGPLVTGSSLTLSGTVIGEVGQNSAGTLRMSFNGNATPSRVDEALSSIAYAYCGSAPPATVQIAWVFSDNNDGSQGSGEALTATGVISVQIYAPPAPTISISALSADHSEGDTGTTPFAFIVTRNGDTTLPSSVSWDVLGQGLFAADAADFGGVMPSGSVGFAVGETSKPIEILVKGDLSIEYDESFVVSLSGLVGATLGTQSAVGTIRSEDTMILGTSGGDILLGTEGKDVLVGREENDTLDGGGGDDVLLGEFGQTNLNPRSGGVISIIGYGIADALFGGDGDDTLDGGIGDDTMQGGTGDDTYVVTSATDVVAELANQGNDTVFSLASYGLPANVENLTLTGSSYASATGNELDNILTGNSGANILVGGAGNDTLLGGNYNDQLSGGAGADNLQGGEGDDIFVIDSVADFAVGEIIDGGNGINELSYSGTSAATLELTSLVSHISTVRLGSTDGDINIDASATVGAYDFSTIVGNAGNNRLVGNNGSNAIYGGSGDDTLIGGGGDDLLNGNAGDDVFLIAAGADHGGDEFIDGEGGSSGGINQIRFTSTLAGDTLTLSSHVSNIQAIAIGDASGATNGTLALNVDAAATVTGVSLIGNAGSNTIVGGTGNDILIGGAGSDTLTGGAGADGFRYSARLESTLAAMDVITDFGGGDTLDFSGMRGVYLRPGSYQYQSSVGTTVAAIQGDAAITNSLVFFSDGSAGYIYIKGSGSGIDLDGTVIQLAGHTSVPVSGEITGLNSAPSISGTSTLPAVNEGSSPAGIRVADLLAGTDYADFDPGDPAGIAVVSASGFGGWQYSTNGSTWTYFPSLSVGQALLLDAESYVRFRPSWSFMSDSASLSLRAWDQTSGIASTSELPQLVIAMPNGGNTAFSSGLHSVQLTVISVNDTPSLSVGPGKVTAFSASSHAGALSISQQADGKIVLAGPVDDYPYGNADFGLARFSADGSLDADFGNGGRLTTSIRSGNEWAQAAAIQQDGRIVVAGYGYETNGHDAEIVVVRYNVDGSLDSSFGGDGKLTTDLGSYQDIGHGVAIQADGRILVAGERGYGVGNTGNYDFALLRYGADGALDASFSGDGVAITDFSGGNDSGHDVAILGDGKILVAGTADAAGDADFALARYSADGSLDASFGVDGKLTTDIAADRDVEYALAVQADGKILLAGTTGGAETRFALVRYNADGSLDTGFGSDGIATTAFRSSYAIQVKDVVLQNDGKILVSGYCSYYPPIPTGLEHVIVGSQTAAVVARYNPDGSLDIGFASDGFLLSDAGAVASVQPDGKILVAGSAGFALARYDSNGLPDTSFGIPVYLTHGAPVVLDSTARAFDEELGMTNLSAGSYSSASLTLARHGGADMHDSFSASGNLGPLTPGAVLTLSDTPIGTVDVNAGGTLTLSFGANASQAMVNETLSSIAYANSSEGPSAAVQIDWTFSDGNIGGAQGIGGPRSVTASTMVNIVATSQTGTPDDDTLSGTSYDDTLLGLAGADTITGGGGNDSIVGGTGLDTARYSGNRADYTVARGASNHYTITDNNLADGNDGIDAVFGIELLQFADTSTSLQISGSWRGIKHNPVQGFWAGTEWQPLDSRHDFNADGWKDVVLSKPDGTVGLWLMNGATPIDALIFDPIPGRTLIDATTDSNGDGRPDLRWHESDGSNSLWLMGSGWVTSAVATPMTPPLIDLPTQPLPPPPVTPPPAAGGIPASPPMPDGWW